MLLHTFVIYLVPIVKLDLQVLIPSLWFIVSTKSYFFIKLINSNKGKYLERHLLPISNVFIPIGWNFYHAINSNVSLDYTNKTKLETSDDWSIHDSLIDLDKCKEEI